MRRLHDDTPSLMRVCFFELMNFGRVVYRNVLSMLIGPRVQFLKGDTGIEFRNVEVWGLGVGPWVIVIRGTYDNSPLCN